MKKHLLIGTVLAASLSFNANAGIWSDAQAVYLDVKGWVLNASKPHRPKW